MIFFFFTHRSSYCRTFSFRYNDFYFNTPAYNCLLSDTGTIQVMKIYYTIFNIGNSIQNTGRLFTSLIPLLGHFEMLRWMTFLFFLQTLEPSSSWDVYKIINRGFNECRGDSIGGRDDGGKLFCLRIQSVRNCFFLHFDEKF